MDIHPNWIYFYGVSSLFKAKVKLDFIIFISVCIMTFDINVLLQYCDIVGRLLGEVFSTH